MSRDNQELFMEDDQFFGVNEKALGVDHFAKTYRPTPKIYPLSVNKSYLTFELKE